MVRSSYVARRRQTPYDVARLLLMAPRDPWQNSTPDFGAVAFCTTNIEDLRTPFDVNLFDKIIDLFIAEEVIEVDRLEEKIMAVIEEDQLEDTNSKRLS